MEPPASLEKHERTLSRNHSDAMLGTIRNCGRAHCSCAARAIHPHPLDARFGTVSHDLLGDLRRCHQQHTVHRRIHRLHPGKTRLFVNLFCLLIHRNCVVASLAEFTKERQRKSLGCRETPTTASRLCPRKSWINCMEVIVPSKVILLLQPLQHRSHNQRQSDRGIHEHLAEFAALFFRHELAP